MKKGTIVAFSGLTCLLAFPIGAEAHVKWFTDLQPEKESMMNILSPLFMGLAVFIAVLLAALTQVLPAFNRWGFAVKTDRRLDQMRVYSMLILKYGTAAALLIQVLSGSLFVPEFHARTVLETAALWAAIVFLLIPHRIATKLGALLILFLFIGVTLDAGWFHMLDYGFYVAIAIVLLLEKTKAEQWGFPFLYLGTGLSLCWVAVEKWVFPEMAIDIIRNHGVPTFGFAPDTFVVMAAFIEFVVGYLLVVGILNRLLAFVLTGIFVSTTMLFGMTELVGHFMIHIVLILFIIEGVSFYKPPVKMHQTMLEQMVFVSLNFIFVLGAFVLIYFRFA